MVGHGGKLPPLQKITAKVKLVKIGGWSSKVQRSLDSYKLSSQTPRPSVSGVNTASWEVDVDVDLEAPIENDSTEWIDVDKTVWQDHTQAHAHVHNHVGNSNKSWAQIASPSASGVVSGSGHRAWSDEGFQEETLQHKAQVHPLFLAYHWVQSNQDGLRITLFQIASSVAQAVGGSTLDAVQPMYSGWYIYMLNRPICFSWKLTPSKLWRRLKNWFWMTKPQMNGKQWPVMKYKRLISWSIRHMSMHGMHCYPVCLPLQRQWEIPSGVLAWIHNKHRSASWNTGLGKTRWGKSWYQFEVSINLNQEEKAQRGRQWAHFLMNLKSPKSWICGLQF